jgi:hypothetical protein
VIAEKSITGCGWRKFQIDPLGDDLSTCTTHSGVKKTHDWVVDQISDLFHTTHKVKTQQVVKRQDKYVTKYCGDIEFTDYLENTTGPVTLVLDLHLSHDRWDSSVDPNLNDNLHYPNDKDRSLNEEVVDKIRKYRSDYNNNNSI